MQDNQDNQVRDLIDLPEGFKSIRYKWVSKNNDFKGNAKRYKA